MCLPIHTYPLSQVYQLGTLTASQKLIFKPPFGTKILGIYLQGGAAFAANDTNYVAIGAINKGVAGAGTGVIVDITNAANSTKATGGTAVAAFIPNTMVLITAANINSLLPNESLEITVTVAATVSIVNTVVIVAYTDPRRT